MPSPEAPFAREMFAATLDWWREAGVDCAFTDEPHAWLAELAASAAKVPAPAPPRSAEPTKSAPPAPARIGGDPAAWPQTAEEFARWWLTEPSLDPAPPTRRVPPLGRAGAELMVLVPMPEEGDEAVLLSGRAGKLLDAMLGAMDLSRDRVYLASALPSRTPAPDWGALAGGGMGGILAHHVALAAPKRLLVLSRSIVSTLIGHDPANNAQNLRAFNHEGGSVPLGACYELEAMLARPALKAGVWKLWLEWTGSETA